MVSSLATARARSILSVSAIVSAIITVVLYLTWGPPVALGFVGGIVTGALMLSALVFVLNRTMVPADDRTGHFALLMVLHGGKFVLAGAIAYVVIKIWEGSAGGFAAGYTVAVAVLFIIFGGAPSSVRLPGKGGDSPQ